MLPGGEARDERVRAAMKTISRCKKGTACVFFLHLDSPMAEPMHDGTSFRFGLIWHVRFPNAADC